MKFLGRRLLSHSRHNMYSFGCLVPAQIPFLIHTSPSRSESALLWGSTSCATLEKEEKHHPLWTKEAQLFDFTFHGSQWADIFNDICHL